LHDGFHDGRRGVEVFARHFELRLDGLCNVKASYRMLAGNDSAELGSVVQMVVPVQQP
jgi:hypothetical protein